MLPITDTEICVLLRACHDFDNDIRLPRCTAIFREALRRKLIEPMPPVRDNGVDRKTIAILTDAGERMLREADRQSQPK